MEVDRIDILLEVSLIPTHLSLPHEVHLEQVLHIFDYLNIYKNIKLKFDWGYARIIPKLFKEYDWFDFYRDTKEFITHNTNEARVHKVSISMYVDYDIAGYNSARHSQTGVLILTNKAPIHWYRNI